MGNESDWALRGARAKKSARCASDRSGSAARPKGACVPIRPFPLHTRTHTHTRARADSVAKCLSNPPPSY